MFLVSSLVDCLFPARCVGCGSYDVWLCASCEVLLPKLSTEKALLMDEYLDGVMSCLDYTDTLVATLIYTLKYHGVEEIAALCARYLEATLQESAGLPGWKIDYLIPVPLAPFRHRWRGFNQSALLAECLSEYVDIPYTDTVLRRVRETKPQVQQVGIIERQRNVADAFRAVHNSRLQGKTCLLIDDVLTTGATLHECAKALKEAGAGAIFAITVAHGGS